MTEISWEAPPPKTRVAREPDRRWMDIAEALRSRPGEWAVVSRDSSASIVTQIRNGRIVAFAGGGFEAPARTIPDTSPKRYQVFARYVGSQS